MSVEITNIELEPPLRYFKLYPRVTDQGSIHHQLLKVCPPKPILGKVTERVPVFPTISPVVILEETMLYRVEGNNESIHFSTLFCAFACQ